MRGTARIIGVCVLGLASSGLTGCNMVPKRNLAQAQLRTQQLYQQNMAIAAERDNQMRLAQEAASQNQTLQQQLADAQSQREGLQSRVDNLLTERQKLQEQFTSYNGNTPNTNPLPDSANRALQGLEDKYKGFVFDPNTGVSEFSQALLFNSGSDELRPEAVNLLKKYVAILNEGESKNLKILVVGHTDDRKVSKPSTKAKHPDNWYLSGDRAIAVLETLSKLGVADSRMGFSGYGPHQPKVENKTDAERAKNRRVEIFVLAPDQAAALDNGSTFKG